MSIKDEFLGDYQREVLNDVDLPDALNGYSVISCLKKSERSTYLLQDEHGKRFVLKTQPVGYPISLAQDFEQLASLNHEQLPKAIRYFEENGATYFLRTYVDGVSLKEQVQSYGNVSEVQCITIMLSLCNVIGYLHGQQPPVIHRDIKPENVVLSADGVCHIIDFDTARRYKPDMTEDTVFIGTRVTAAPEQFGYKQTDARTDIYALGMLMRFLLTSGYDAPCSINGLNRIILRCTAFDPARRFSGVSSLRLALLLQMRWHAAALAVAGLVIALLAIVMVPFFINGAEPTVAFSEEWLDQAVRYELGLEPDDELTQSMLDGVEELVICGQEQMVSANIHANAIGDMHDPYDTPTPHGSISTLDEIKLLSNLKTLILDYQNISDLSALNGLSLEVLSLAGNRIFDLSPLSECTALRELNVAENPIVDIGVLDELPSLVSLHIGFTNVKSLEVLRGSAIDELHFWGAPIQDCDPLIDCAYLRILEAGELSVEELKQIGKVTSLRTLLLRNCDYIEDYTCFTQLQRLADLDICGCTYGSLDGLEILVSLTYLNLCSTNTTSINFLPKLPYLKRIDLRANAIDDLAPLLLCTRLSDAIFDETQKSQAEALLHDTDIALEFHP